LIYNDLIVLNCCGLDYNTYSGINSRLNSDNIERKDTYDSLVYDYETNSNNSQNSSRTNSYEMKIINCKNGIKIAI